MLSLIEEARARLLIRFILRQGKANTNSISGSESNSVRKLLLIQLVTVGREASEETLPLNDRES
jgi:hypothetical protein